MSLQPTNTQKSNKPTKKGGFPIKSAIICGVVLVVIIVGIISINQSGNSSNPVEQEPINTTYEYTTADTEPIVTEPPLVVSQDGPLSSVDIPNATLFTRTKSAFDFSYNLAYEEGYNISDSGTFMLGNHVMVTPMKTCVYKYEANKLSFVHNTGTLIGIYRSGYKGDIDWDNVSTSIKKSFSAGKCKDISIGDVFVGTSNIGTIGTGEVSVDDTVYYMSLAYIFFDDELYTIVGMSEPGYSDFLDLMYKTITINNKAISFGGI